MARKNKQAPAAPAIVETAPDLGNIVEALESAVVEAAPLPSRSIVPPAYRAACAAVKHETKTAKGNKSVDCNDTLASFLRGKTVEQVAAIAESAGCGSAQALLARYAKLNVGQQRMNIGNRIRAVVKDGTWQVPTAQ
jgi:hypothetical protein